MKLEKKITSDKYWLWCSKRKLCQGEISIWRPPLSSFLFATDVTRLKSLKQINSIGYMFGAHYGILKGLV